MARRQILVTGSEGFIGSHLTERLVSMGHRVRALVQYNSFNSWGWLDSVSPEIKNQFEVVLGDIRDPYGIKEAVKGCDSILHLAALIAIPYSYRSPEAYVDTNVKGTLNVLQAARELGVSRLVHTSTSEVYGTAIRVPIDEEHPLQGQSPYSATKIGADQMALSYYRSFGTPVMVLRPFNTYGPRQSTRAVIPTIVTQLAAGQRRINLGALTPTRDFTFVQDTVSGFVAALESNVVGEVINVCSGHEISILETARLISEIMGCSPEIVSAAERLRPELSEVERLWGDHKKAKVQLDWQPKYAGRSGLTQGLRETVEWFSQAENLARYKTGIYSI